MWELVKYLLAVIGALFIASIIFMSLVVAVENRIAKKLEKRNDGNE